MSHTKFQQLINDFSPTSLLEVFRGHDFFRIKENTLASFNDKQFIEFAQLGDFDLEDNTNIIVICARSLTHLNERASRKTQYDIGKKILKNFPKSRAGLFVYYDNKGDFRMSLIYADYVGTKVNYSTFRRFTYFVSKEQKNVTFLQQVAPLNFTNFKELKELFSVEKVTKEFFKKYRELFNELLEDFEQNNEFNNVVVKTGISTTPDFVKKLMGQIVFLYFVQKKGWLGVQPNKNWGEGDYSYLRTLFENCKKANKNYFNDYLEPLFYEALAEKRGEDDFFEKLNCRVPFLNGGLFESVYDWKNTEINIHNEVLGKLLDFFDQYNFTVDENTPSDQEISVDPEMLGKIFENLLEVKDRKDKGAFYTPREIVHYMCRESLIQHLVSEETAPEERIRKIFEIKDTDLSVLMDDDKKTEAIKRMQELKDIAEKVDISLRNVKIVDPAVGSGAFPMGMLNEISSVRYYLNTNFIHKKNNASKELSLYDIKKETLENCIYAVDLEPGAVEIAKLRFWLALIVEFESNDPKIAPPVLPNLDYKIMQGNSLLEEYEGVKLFDEKIIKTIDTGKEKQIEDLKKKQSVIQKEYLELMSKDKLSPVKKVELDTEAKNIHEQLKKLNQVEKNDIEKSGLFDFDKNKESKLKAEELKSLQKQFFETNKKDKKESIKKQIEKLEWELIEATLIEQGKTSELSKIEEFKKSKTKPFFLWKLHFADVFEQKGGFDIVIGNPPYVKEDINKGAFSELKNNKYYQGKMDLWYFFACISLDLIRKDGVECFIAPNNWISSDGATKLRKKIIQESKILEFMDFGDYKVFNSAGIQTMILVARKTIENEEYLVKYSRLLNKNISNDELINFLNKKEDSNFLVYKPKILKSNLEGKNITFLESNNSKILDRISENGSFYLNGEEVLSGIDVSQDFVNKEHKEILGESFSVKDGIFVISDKEKELLTLSPEEESLLKPFYTTQELFKYFANKQNKYWIIYTDSNFKNPHSMDKFPNLKKHLDKFQKIITSDNKPYGLNRARNDGLSFVGEKIISKRKCPNSPVFTYVNFDTYFNRTFLQIITERINLKYLVGILNSHIVSFWLRNKGKMQGTNYQIDKNPLLNVPIKKVSESDQKPLIELVDKILNIAKTEDYLTNTEKQSEVKKIEHQIDELVYKLYDLTPEEIEIVENSSKK